MDVIPKLFNINTGFVPVHTSTRVVPVNINTRAVPVNTITHVVSVNTNTRVVPVNTNTCLTSKSTYHLHVLQVDLSAVAKFPHFAVKLRLQRP